MICQFQSGSATLVRFGRSENGVGPLSQSCGQHARFPVIRQVVYWIHARGIVTRQQVVGPIVGAIRTPDVWLSVKYSLARQYPVKFGAGLLLLQPIRKLHSRYIGTHNSGVKFLGITNRVSPTKSLSVGGVVCWSTMRTD